METEEGNELYSYSHNSSTNSLNAMTSSTNNTDDEDSDMGTQFLKDRRREAHTHAEQKRRDAIKKGYDSLQELIPIYQNADQTPSHKISKATVLQKSIEYINYMQNMKKKSEEEVQALQKEKYAMSIMKMNYEQIVTANLSQPGNMSQQVPEDVKFEVYRAVMDSLFQTFDPCISTNNFADVSRTVIQWVEEHCKPQILREIMRGVLTQLHQYDLNQQNTDATLMLDTPQPNSGAVVGTSVQYIPQ